MAISAYRLGENRRWKMDVMFKPELGIKNNDKIVDINIDDMAMISILQ